MADTQNEPVEVTQAELSAAREWLCTKYAASHPNHIERLAVDIMAGKFDHETGAFIEGLRHRMSASSAVVDALREADQSALEGYRAAVLWIGADSWDGCSDCMEMLRRARSIDDFHWSPDEHAHALKRLNERAGRAALANTSKQSAEVYLVWSNEHRAWWRPDSCGYTIKLEAAGRYTREEAIDIAGGRLGWIKDRQPDEIPVLERDALDAVNRILSALEGERS